MCGDRRCGTPSQTVQNLPQPMLLTGKVRLSLSNNWRKARTLSDCCGNYGEPGC